jgi:hypothetical protein
MLLVKLILICTAKYAGRLAIVVLVDNHTVLGMCYFPLSQTF